MQYEEDEDTKYEEARLVGARALQIAMGAPILVDRNDEFNPVKIAKREYEEDKIPMTVVRVSRRESRRGGIGVSEEGLEGPEEKEEEAEGESEEEEAEGESEESEGEQESEESNKDES